jgi:hypothetical protein
MPPQSWKVVWSCVETWLVSFSLECWLRPNHRRITASWQFEFPAIWKGLEAGWLALATVTCTETRQTADPAEGVTGPGRIVEPEQKDLIEVRAPDEDPPNAPVAGIALTPDDSTIPQANRIFSVSMSIGAARTRTPVNRRDPRGVPPAVPSAPGSRRTVRVRRL